jgi:hypothetical protein
MPDRDLIRAWLRQAECDLTAARSNASEILECHRRYWLQQACEKGIKALGLILWRTPSADDGCFQREFLHRHSPLKNLKETQGIPKSLVSLLRQLEAELTVLDGRGLLMKVDGTTPTTDLKKVSYRYPFKNSDDQVIAPADYKQLQWDDYQGNIEGVTSAIDRFLKVVRNRSKAERT